MIKINIEELCCPLGKARLTLYQDKMVCTKCGVKFTVIDGIPILLMDSAMLPEGIGAIEDLSCRKKNGEETK